MSQIGFIHIGQNQIRTLAGKKQGRRTADAAPGSSYNSVFTIQPSRHIFLLFAIEKFFLKRSIRKLLFDVNGE
jgi:hypothetical protein